MYSLYDLVQDIKHGRRDDFPYNGETFTAKTWKTGYKITRVKTGHVAACPFYFGAGIDFQGVACCLIQTGTDLEFDKHGEIINREQAEIDAENEHRAYFQD